MSERGKLIKILVEGLGKRFSSQLGIDLSSGKNEEIFKWFLASVIFGARISEAIVVKTYKEFEKEDVVSPSKILKTGWDGLVKILDKGGYVRYDFKTATKLLEVMKNFKDRYEADFDRLYQEAQSPKDLENRIKGLGKGIGQVTVGIFLRELRGLWQKADPSLSSLVLTAAGNLKLIKREDTALSGLENLKLLWKENEVREKEFVDFETALLRLAKDWCRRRKCSECIVKRYCPLFLGSNLDT
jgi:endonuclease III